ncbi:hypothetical protein K440DRAFT_553242, partial [Wilcoxina mikolae CBS 423.85]
FALLIDNALTPAECASLLALADTHTWEPALLNVGYGQQELRTDVRKCGRVIVDSPDIAAQLYARIVPVLEKEGVHVIGGAKGRWEGMRSHWLGDTPWRLTRMNERLRFLKYGPGEYFRPHCDGSYCTPDDSERSLLTFHAYLGENGPENVGGATRFFGGNWDQEVGVDVEPVQGRVLVFQHQWLVHSGEEMVSGVKYTVRSDFMYERAPELAEEEEFRHYREGVEVEGL